MAERGSVVSLRGVLKVARGAIAASAFGLLATSLAQCSADGGGSQVNAGGSANSASGGNGGSAASGSGGTFSDATISPDVATKDYSAEDFFIEDPPPQGCDGGGQPVVPGGTPECPDDKNLPGCPCAPEGKTAPCWPGLRKHRNKGDCKDGVTTCEKIGEIQTVWGPCVGYTGLGTDLLPKGTTGKAACTCFSGGFWKIDNLSPCFVSQTGGSVLGGISTIMPGNCPPQASTMDWNNPQPPSEPWSTNYVTSDCTGFFKLCFTLKGLSAPNAQPAPGDCTMKQVCTEAYYSVANQQQKFPDLPGWVTATAQEKSCAQAFVSNGGYAELSVVGESDECDKVNKIFQTVTYCPLKCAPSGTAGCGNKTCDAGENATSCASDCDPVCKNCTNGGGGPF